MEALEKAAAAPTLKPEIVRSPVIIDSIALLRRHGEYLVHDSGGVGRAGG
jgi:hypothetical protein